MNSKLSDLSAFVLELNVEAQRRGVDDLVNWAVRALADVLGFDAAWYGWAQVQQTGTVIHASSVYNLPQTYFDAWTSIADQDVLVDQFIEDPLSVPCYDRFGGTQTDGMEQLADAFGITKMATAMSLRPGRTASFFLSAYRGGRRAHSWSREECEFLQCVVDNISSAARISAGMDAASLDARSASVFLSEQGATLIGLQSVRALFGHLWSRSDGDRVPRWLTDYIAQPGEHILPDQDLALRCETLKANSGPALYRVSLRPLRKFDQLSRRERDVASVLASGKSHKEAARLLGVAPSTVRNHTQSIYAKLGIDNRASLAAHVPIR